MGREKQHCCERMMEQVNYTCSEHADAFECADKSIHYSARFDEYGIIIHDGGSSSSVIEYCPWCGAKLPGSKRDLWFETLAALGYDDPTRQQIPAKFMNEEWYAAG